MIDAQELLRMDICDLIYGLRSKIPETCPRFRVMIDMLSAVQWIADEELIEYRKGKQ